MAKKTKQVQVDTGLPLVVGRNTAFFYRGAIRSGKVEKVTENLVVLQDFGRNGAFRSFKRSLINAD